MKILRSRGLDVGRVWTLWNCYVNINAFQAEGSDFFWLYVYNIFIYLFFCDLDRKRRVYVVGDRLG